MEQKTAQVNAPKPTAPAAKTDALTLARATRQAESARRAKLTPEQRFKEDLTDLANRIANTIDGQRGDLYGVVQRGLMSDAVSKEDVVKVLSYITRAQQRVADLLTVQKKEGFSL